MGLMEKFADPALIGTLSFGEKMAGSFITMLMGMGVTFVVLCLLWAFVAIMGKFIGAAPSTSQPIPINNDDEVIAAVIAAAITAYHEEGGTSNLIVKKISRTSDRSTLWTKITGVY